MFSQVTNLACNGLIIRWLQVQVLSGPPPNDLVRGFSSTWWEVDDFSQDARFRGKR